VFHVLLQVLDDGRVTDSQGRTVDFKNTVVILTSNIGAPLLLDGIDRNGEISESARSGVMAELRRGFRPEFLNRIDEIVLFKPLQPQELAKIVDLLVAGLRARLDERGVTLEIDDAARRWIAERGYDPVFGARPLKRLLQRELETRIGRAIVAGEVPEGSRVRVVVEDGHLALAR
jgi:ATP-dependent Clp protease ATP-binding subunit ClpB